MTRDLENLFEVFANWAMQHGGAENAADYLVGAGMIDEETAEQLAARFNSNVAEVQTGGPVLKPRHEESWYQGALPSDPRWAQFRQKLITKGRESLIPSLNSASDTIVRLTPAPSGPPRSARGLVVGFIQSGKTTNFTAVAAKLADRNYRMIIVLAGIHNALREQTQERLNEDLVEGNSERWFTITGLGGDFDLTKVGVDAKTGPHKQDAVQFLTAHDKTSLLVVKKNAAVLKKLLKWLGRPEARNALKAASVLVIDDEADQASVETATINPLIRDILALMPRGTYIGYTATPFANVFIDPSDEDDLYPRDFIYPLPQPKGYFGPEMLFGRDDPGVGQADVDGYDMVRSIPDEDEFKLRPMSKREVDGFVPVVTDGLRLALRWFVLATAARWVRGDAGDSSMLIHTSFQTAVHDKYVPVIDREIEMLSEAVSGSVMDAGIIGELRSQWFDETSRVPAEDWGRRAESFDAILEKIPEVIADIKIIVDNYRSDERLNYENGTTNTIIAIGGNTLSRGITLEGLVSSLFIRPTNTYDTLLQMGRWFGFRVGYEDLPRIWTTKSLEHAFRHLALVEHEMRQDMAVYELQNITPQEAAVKIRTHPTLRVTAKMGAALPQRTSYAGARLQTRFFKRYDKDWLENNWMAAERLLADSSRMGQSTLPNGGRLFKNVTVSSVRTFLENFSVLPDQADMNIKMILKYIEQQNALDEAQLTSWNIALMSGTGGLREVGSAKIKTVQRAPYRDSGSIADIKTLMSKEDLVVDIEGLSVAEARKLTEASLKLRRIENEQTRSKGLLVLYPIDPESEPGSDRSAKVRENMDAVGPVMGLALVFPRAADSVAGVDSVKSTHLSVELADHAEEIDTHDEMWES
ncbi:Z1 domain-containing protein [Jongsikchunia kroppenstedtii]|uniref:Z1 domain-containing protein n=1 Tax=Jongsikchunia kroppenstedtii TaxID=1121721 RepID=UPI000363BBCB|nr:Z1 domain-containing protein [Jongsikchunia kroppenstedtii]